MTSDAIERMMDPDCVFCSIVAGRIPASFVEKTSSTVAFLDQRQFHPGHVLIIPRRHLPDLRALDPSHDQVLAGELLMQVARVAAAVSKAFPSDGVSVWHSAGEGAHQEVPHLHLHVHPRKLGDELLRVYPSSPPTASREVLDRYAAAIRSYLTAP